MENSTVIESTVVPSRQLNLGGVLNIPAVRQVTTLVGVAAAVAAGFAIVLWSQTPSYTQMYGDLSAAEAAEVADALMAADIEYKVDSNSGSVLVVDGQIHKARMQLASQGLPQSASAGMEMMQDQSSFGVSQFMESARYQHALEAELGRTIASMGAVREARVHLALPKQTAFIRDQKSASASVLLQLFRGRALEADQASAIVHLVASSVPNLGSKDVTLIDQHGRLLSRPDDQASDVRASSQFKYTQRLEESYRRRIEEMLTPLVGAGRVRAQVVADLDFTMTEETRESFDPARSVIRSEQISEEQHIVGSTKAAGVPGALSNQPPEGSDTQLAQNQSQQETSESEPVNTSRSSTRNFEVDRVISHIRPQAGTVRRLSIAVLLDDGPGDTGDTTTSLTETEVERFTSLVKKAVGFDEARGDTVVVVNAAFKAIAPLEEEVALAFWEKPVFRDALRQLLGATIALAVAFGIVRPMLRSLIAPGASMPAEYLGNVPNYRMAGGSVPAGGPGALPSYDEKVAAAKNITGHDPARVAQVVKKWVNTDE